MRKAIKSDAPQILDFCLELREEDAKMSFTSFDSIEKIEGYFDDPRVFLYITEDCGHVTSMFRAVKGEGHKSHAAYIACAVKSSHRKLSLATKITLFGLEDVKNQGVKIARTYIYSWNKASIKTIEKCGFEASGRVFMHQYEPDLDAYIDDLIYHKVL